MVSSLNNIYYGMWYYGLKGVRCVFDTNIREKPPKNDSPMRLKKGPNISALQSPVPKPKTSNITSIVVGIFMGIGLFRLAMRQLTTAEKIVGIVVAACVVVDSVYLTKTSIRIRNQQIPIAEKLRDVFHIACVTATVAVMASATGIGSAAVMRSLFFGAKKMRQSTTIEIDVGIKVGGIFTAACSIYYSAIVALAVVAGIGLLRLIQQQLTTIEKVVGVFSTALMFGIAAGDYSLP